MEIVSNRIVPIVLFVVLPLAAAGGVLTLAGGDPNPGFVDADAALVFIAAVAIGIERVIEAFWGAINMRTPWWPMSALSKSVKEFQDAMDVIVRDQLTTLEEGLTAAAGAIEAGTAAQVEAMAAVDGFKATKAEVVRRAAVINKLSPGNERLTLLSDLVMTLSGTADHAIGKVGMVVSDAAAPLQRAGNLAVAAKDLVGSYKENPSRRLLSISFGATIGLVVAGFFQLNLFVAAAATPVTDPGTAAPSSAAAVVEGQSEQLAGIDGILLTGLILGLGSAPTHEVIRLVQQSKRNRKTTGDSVPGIAPLITTAISEATGGVVAFTPGSPGGGMKPVGTSPMVVSRPAGARLISTE